MRYLTLLILMACIPKNQLATEEQNSIYSADEAALELLEEDEAFEDLPEAGDEDEE
jgi:hypothetical protein